jgi:hypothetical protein
MLFYKIRIFKKARNASGEKIGATSETCSHIKSSNLNTSLPFKARTFEFLGLEIYGTCKQTKFNPKIRNKWGPIT